MSNDAIASICLASTLCVMMICLCVSSCYHSKYYYTSNDENTPYNQYTTHWKTTTCTIPTESLDKEDYIKLLESLISGMNTGAFSNVKLDNKEVTVDTLRDLIKEVKSSD